MCAFFLAYLVGMFFSCLCLKLTSNTKIIRSAAVSVNHFLLKNPILIHRPRLRYPTVDNAGNYLQVMPKDKTSWLFLKTLSLLVDKTRDFLQDISSSLTQKKRSFFQERDEDTHTPLEKNIILYIFIYSISKGTGFPWITFFKNTKSTR